MNQTINNNGQGKPIKSKVFVFGNVSTSLSREINEWFAENINIRIVNMLQSECLKYTTISIFYFEDAKRINYGTTELNTAGP